MSEHRNGTAVPGPLAGTGAQSSDEPAPAPAWSWSYERASVERFQAEVEAERARLLAEIDAARARAADAAAARAEADEHGSAELAALVDVVVEELDRLEREHAATVSAMRAAAEAEARRILEAAQAEVAALRSSTGTMAGLVPATPAVDGDAPDQVRSDGG